MSQSGHLRRFRDAPEGSGSPPIADMQRLRACPFRAANNGRELGEYAMPATEFAASHRRTALDRSFFAAIIVT
jgi:hypothetical protein